MEKLIGYEQEIKEDKILSVQINLLNKCTSRCRSCRKYTWPNDILPIDTVKQIVIILQQNFGLRTIVFSGGDPVLYPNFGELIQFCNKNYIKCSMITTGITKRSDILSTMCNDMFRIHLSLDAINRDDYSYIRGVDAFEIVDNNIRLISEQRKRKNMLPIRLSSTISKMNYMHTYELYKYAKKNGCLINFYLVHTFDNLSMLKDDIDVFYNLLKNIVIDENNNNIISNARSLLYDYEYGKEHKVCERCYIPNISCVINANGDVYPCCRVFKDNGFYGDQVEFAYGNICDKQVNEIIDIFNKRLHQVYPIQNNEECKECGQRYYEMIHHLAKVKENKQEALFI